MLQKAYVWKCKLIVAVLKKGPAEGLPFFCHFLSHTSCKEWDTVEFRGVFCISKITHLPKWFVGLGSYGTSSQSAFNITWFLFLCVPVILTICRSKIDNQVLLLVTSVLQMTKGFLQNTNVFCTFIYLFFASSDLGTTFVFCVPACTFYVYRRKRTRVFGKEDNIFSPWFLCYKMGVTVLTL